MLIAYMSHLELCFEIFDEQVLEFISKNVTYVFDTSSFLGSFELKLQSNCAWEVTEDIKYHFGWILETSQDTEFFDPRCL